MVSPLCLDCASSSLLPGYSPSLRAPTSSSFAGKVKASETGKPDEEFDIYSSEYEYDYSGGKHSLLHPFSFGVAYGIGVEYKKWLAGISGKSMCLGQDDEGFEAKEHNLVLTLGVTYRF